VQNKSSNTERVFGNVLSLGTGEIVARLIALFGIGFLARKLGPEGFGIIGFATALFGYLGLAVTAGFNDIGAREVARRPQRAAAIAFNVISVKIALASFIFVVLGFVIWLLDNKQTVNLIVLLMSLSLFSLAIDTSWVYRGLERSHRIGIALFLGQIVYVAGLLLLIRDVRDIFFVPVAQLIGELSAALLLLVPLYRLEKIKLNIRDGLRILTNSYYWTISRLMRLLNGTFDVVMLGFLMDERTVGLYTATYRICFSLLAISVAVHTSYLPAVTRAMALGLQEAGRVAERSINLAAVISAPLVLGGMILAARILEALFGPEYVEGAPAFRLLLLSIGLVFLHGAHHNVLLAADRTKTEMIIFSIGAAFNVGLNLIIIPHYGIVGAAAVTMTAEFLTLIMGLFVISRIGIPLNFFRAVWRPLTASVLMAAVVFALDAAQSLFLSVGIGAICYALFLIILRGIPQDVQSYFHTVAAFANDLRIKFSKI
jgi:O-antigen/teichoic acid export membrane protein